MAADIEALPAGGKAPHLLRRLGLLQAAALNMTNMIGVGPFITIPLLMSAVGGGGPQAMLGWLIGVLIAVPDGMIWSELGAALPGSGGSYVYLREGFGRETWGRLMAFLFIWQFVFSGPLEIASGYIGFAQYLGYVWPGMTPGQEKLVAAVVGVVNVALLYRQITAVGRITVCLWIATLLTTGTVIVAGAAHFNPRLAFDFPPHAFQVSLGFVFGLGAATRFGIYDYLGYYDICYLGDEVKDPGRVIPRSILISIVGVALIYAAMNLCIIGVVPWRTFVPAEQTVPASHFVVSVFMERIFNRRVAELFTVMILLTSFASVFALLLGYSRIPYAAALDGCFFRVFARVHPREKFPHVSLLAIGAISVAGSFISLDMVISALLTTRILVQFIGQIAAVHRLRRTAPGLARPYRIWLYPLPSLVALAGWLFVFVTAERSTVLFGLGSLACGALFFLVWSRATRRWPFRAVPQERSQG